MTRTLHLRHQVALPSDRVMEWLGTMDRLVRVHPLLISAHPMTGGRLGPGWYRVRERVARGPLPLTFTYPACLDVDLAARQVRIHARIWKVIRVTMRFDIHPDPSGQSCRVEEEVEFRSILPVAGTMGEVFRVEHAALFRAMEAQAVEAVEATEAPAAETRPGQGKPS